MLDLHIGAPSAKQTDLIQEFVGREIDPEDWVVVPYMASNNFIDFGYRRWHLDILVQMAKGFPGRPLLLDHDWYESDKAVAFLFDAKLVKDLEVSDETLNGGDFAEFNQQILDEEGYVWLYLCAAIPKNEDDAQAILNRKFNDCSTGSILKNPRLICPNCTAEKGREIGFFDRDKNDEYICPHLVPSNFMFWLMEGREDVQFADYAILTAEHHEAIELSNVNRGALPAASVIREYTPDDEFISGSEDAEERVNQLMAELSQEIKQRLAAHVDFQTAGIA